MNTSKLELLALMHLPTFYLSHWLTNESHMYRDRHKPVFPSQQICIPPPVAVSDCIASVFTIAIFICPSPSSLGFSITEWTCEVSKVSSTVSAMTLQRCVVGIPSSPSWTKMGETFVLLLRVCRPSSTSKFSAPGWFRGLDFSHDAESISFLDVLFVSIAARELSFSNNLCSHSSSVFFLSSNSAFCTSRAACRRASQHSKTRYSMIQNNRRTNPEQR